MNQIITLSPRLLPVSMSQKLVQSGHSHKPLCSIMWIIEDEMKVAKKND